MQTTTVRGWGRATSSRSRVIGWPDDLGPAGPRGLIARGGGCGYGDAAQNAGGVVALTAHRDDLTELFVDEDGTVLLDAGTSLGELIRSVAPLGWTLPVIPGTARVTVGGAIAADVHGKNHIHTGSFGSHVREMTVLTPGQGELVLGPQRHPDAFRATVGGLGLTGVIQSARLALTPLDSWQWRTTDTIAPDLDALMTALRLAAPGSEYAVGWIDATRGGRHLGGGVLSTSRPVPGTTPPAYGRPSQRRLRLPGLPATGLGLPGVTAVLNRARMLAARSRNQSFPQVLFPLDALPDWARLHGRRGLIQYQFVVPFGAEDVLAAALTETRRAGFPATLAVLKVFGASSEAFLSFPIPGWSLALDFPAVADLAPVLDALDERVAAAGGRVYLVKDSRLRPGVLETMYPDLGRWRAERALLDPDGVMVSDLDRRLGLSGGGRA
ncbi:FAD-binding oxidoreductase [Actinoplanes bogorensis]|uniref:FAD-binding oxidoreductase n=1 Tax=Paractinoplanes bogorensis TaxID=1610840 RepID=A0ABS5YZ58_9ACTN|nr:FAD-binding oxidoreductase [Actinoplanes bogorensis]MBU2667998.1 FAD-binding oxidoreductase [Actinoplanes bogorensis]